MAVSSLEDETTGGVGPDLSIIGASLRREIALSNTIFPWNCCGRDKEEDGSVTYDRMERGSNVGCNDFGTSFPASLFWMRCIATTKPLRVSLPSLLM